MPEKQYRIILVDDHALIRQSLKIWLKIMFSNVEIVGEGCNGFDAIELYHELHPDFVLIDVDMPEMNGIEATRSILQDDPAARIVALTGSAESVSVKAQLRDAGAIGCISKQASVDEVRESLLKLGVIEQPSQTLEERKALSG